MSEAPETLRADQRRLAAILAADVAGYSRLMGRDEAATVRDLEAHQAAIFPIVAKYGGSLINVAGDGVVAQFPSAVRAVECAVAIQKVMAERNAGVPVDRRMLMRIGVNLGDIIHDGNRAYGDGINVAARLEPLAEPGGICISATVREAIFGKLRLPLRDLGEKALKNIDRPVRIYHVQPPGTRLRRNWLTANLPRRRQIVLALGIILVLGLSGLAAWRLWPRDTLTPDYTPVVAVLPFGNADRDAELDHLGPSFAREVASVLSTFPLLRVVSASDLPPQKLASPKLAAQEVGANYALGGDLAKSGGKTRVRAELIDAANGETAWSDTYVFEGDDPVAIEEKTAERIYRVIAGIEGKVRKAEEAAAWRKPESSLTDYDYYLRSLTYFLRYTPDDNMRSRKIAEDGLARFPQSPLLKIRLAWTYMTEADSYGPFENCRELAEMAYKLGREAEDAKAKSRFLIYMSRKIMAHAYAWHGEDLDRSAREAEAAVEMSPYDAELRASLSFYLANAGKLDEATQWASWAIAHDDHKNMWVQGNLAWAQYLLGRHEEARQTLKGVESSNLAMLAVVNIRLGRLDEAEAAIAEWLKTGRHSLETESCWPIREPLKTMYLDDLRKAGLPERTSQ